MEGRVCKVNLERGDWGTLFRRPFCKVVGGSLQTILLTTEEKVAYTALIADNGRTTCWSLLEEFSLKNVNLSKASDKGISFPLVFTFISI